MPVLKFRSVEGFDEHRRDLWCETPDDKWFHRIASLWRRSAHLNPRRFTPGVRKYRTVKEAQADRERWLQKHVDALRKERSGPLD